MPSPILPNSARMPGSSDRCTTSSSATHSIRQSMAAARHGPMKTLIGIDNLSKRHLTFSLFSPQFRDIVSHAKIEVEPFEPIPANYRVRQPASSGVGAVPWNNQGLVAAPMSDSFNIWLAQDRHAQKYGSLVVVVGSQHDPQTRMPGRWWRRNLQAPLRRSTAILSFDNNDWTIGVSRSAIFSTPNGSQQRPLRQHWRLRGPRARDQLRAHDLHPEERSGPRLRSGEVPAMGRLFDDLQGPRSEDSAQGLDRQSIRRAGRWIANDVAMARRDSGHRSAVADAARISSVCSPSSGSR